MRAADETGRVRSRARPINWEFVSSVLRIRREDRRMKAAGYRRHETDWEINRGGRMEDVIVDAQISQCGKYVWTKLGKPHP